MDKPLSQERLSDDEMESAQHYLKYKFESTFTQLYGAKLINEVKRLQDIEQELNHRCETFELSKNEAWKLYRIIDQHNSELQQELKKLKGADTNE